MNFRELVKKFKKTMLLKEVEDDDFLNMDFYGTLKKKPQVAKKSTRAVRSGNQLRNKLVNSLPQYMKAFDAENYREKKVATASLTGIVPKTQLTVEANLFVKYSIRDGISVRLEANGEPIIDKIFYTFLPEEEIISSVRKAFDTWVKYKIPDLPVTVKGTKYRGRPGKDIPKTAHKSHWGEEK